MEQVSSAMLRTIQVQFMPSLISFGQVLIEKMKGLQLAEDGCM
jgi:hypothetical protein